VPPAGARSTAPAGQTSHVSRLPTSGRPLKGHHARDPCHPSRWQSQNVRWHFAHAGPADACLAYRRTIPPRGPKSEAGAPPVPKLLEVSCSDKPYALCLPRHEGGPRFHPCRRVREALRSAGIEYEKVIAAHGSPLPFLRKGSRDELFEAIGTRKLPALRLPDGTVLVHSKPILSWVEGERRSGHSPPSRSNQSGTLR
jgi:glutathione S-transferase-like protein